MTRSQIKLSSGTLEPHLTGTPVFFCDFILVRTKPVSHFRIRRTPSIPRAFRGPLMTVFYCTFMSRVLCFIKNKSGICFPQFLLATLEVERIKYYNFIVCVNKHYGIYGSKILFKDLFQEMIRLRVTFQRFWLNIQNVCSNLESSGLRGQKICHSEINFLSWINDLSFSRYINIYNFNSLKFCKLISNCLFSQFLKTAI